MTLGFEPSKANTSFSAMAVPKRNGRVHAETQMGSHSQLQSSINYYHCLGINPPGFERGSINSHEVVVRLCQRALIHPPEAALRQATRPSSSSRQSDSTKAENGFRCGGIEGSPDHEHENGVAWTRRKGIYLHPVNEDAYADGMPFLDGKPGKEDGWKESETLERENSGLEDLTVALNSDQSSMSRRPRRSGRLKQPPEVVSSPADGSEEFTRKVLVIPSLLSQV
ncbi:hypothetical protein ARMGADRAFT_1040574 [Armillaria gallica]|uniref:Uncharacterized protein n=1 Tax=Armillaria gallica TaxID=47427 RepID=A0A2H3C9F7_ARMGA|nr:hypothetical protein ARMGADRAFT_1040574 [Armillaria gallica]